MPVLEPLARFLSTLSGRERPPETREREDRASPTNFRNRGLPWPLAGDSLFFAEGLGVGFLSLVYFFVALLLLLSLFHVAVSFVHVCTFFS